MVEATCYHITLYNFVIWLLIIQWDGDGLDSQEMKIQPWVG